FAPRPDWHATELPALPSVKKLVVPPSGIVNALQEYAEALLEEENTKYSGTHLKSSSSHKFLSTIMSSGTLEDKVSALTLLVQESPLHTTKAFENLVGLAKKKSRNQALMALSALKDLLGQGVVLPPDRKLKAFAKQPDLINALQGKHVQWRKGWPLPGNLQDVHLISWAYEDWLKRTYFDLLKVLEQWCSDEIEYARSRAVTYVWELLKEKPEQEENLLRLLINKLGDKDRKIASRASYLLLQLQVTHPVMKGVIISAIESECLLRPGLNSHAKYYAVITLNQTVLSAREQEVANKLLNIYFALFVGLLKMTDPGKPQSSAPGSTASDLVQGGGGTPGKKSRQKEKMQEKMQEEVHVANAELNEKIIAQVLTGVNRAYPFARTDDAHFVEQLDTLFRITHSANFNTSVQALLLIQQISSSKHHSADRFYRVLYESLLDPRLLTSSKQILYLNLLYRSLKSDVSIKRVKAFVKRLLQIITLHEPPFACGVLYLIGELQTTFPSIKGMLDQPEEAAGGDEETFVDADKGVSPVQDGKTGHNGTTTGSHIQYDGRKRDPEYSNAERSCLWELLPFQSHFHPSVSLFASRLLLSGEMPSKPDPSLHTVMHFLDRFVYRNARTKTDVTRGSSIMQPMVGSAAADLLIKKRDGSKTELPLNTESFWLRKAEEVAPDEVFFHQYFNQPSKKKSPKEKKEKKRKDEAGSDGEGDEEEIWEALVNSRPEIENEDDEDEQGFSDMEGLMSDGSDEVDGVDGIDEAGDEEGVGEEEGEAEGAEGSDDFDAPDLDSEDDAMMGSDEEVPVDIPDAQGDSDEEPSAKEPSKSQQKRSRRKKLKQLPTFASAEDYAKLLEDEDDE
ncbi:CBF-domain-containing protein, partial [Rhizodiscina lignyota]